MLYNILYVNLFITVSIMPSSHTMLCFRIKDFIKKKNLGVLCAVCRKWSHFKIYYSKLFVIWAFQKSLQKTFFNLKFLNDKVKEYQTSTIAILWEFIHSKVEGQSIPGLHSEVVTLKLCNILVKPFNIDVYTKMCYRVELH